MKCYICGKEKETRPYGENFQNICFDCMENDLRLQEVCKTNFNLLLTTNIRYREIALFDEDIQHTPKTATIN